MSPRSFPLTLPPGTRALAARCASCSPRPLAHSPSRSRFFPMYTHGDVVRISTTTGPIGSCKECLLVPRVPGTFFPGHHAGTRTRIAAELSVFIQHHSLSFSSGAALFLIAVRTFSVFPTPPHVTCIGAFLNTPERHYEYHRHLKILSAKPSMYSAFASISSTIPAPITI